jgi:hypothetical protein
MAISRRTRTAPSGRNPSQASARNRAPSALEPINPSPDVEEPVADYAEAPAAEGPWVATSQSSRRSAVSGRNSRRAREVSSAKLPTYKSGRVLTPEQRAQRRKTIKNIIVLLICLLLFVGVVAGGLMWMRGGKAFNEAQLVLKEAESKLELINKSITMRQPREARAAFTVGLKLLTVPSLGNAKEPINENDPNLASRSQALKAVEIAKLIRETESQIDKIERDIKAEANHRLVMDGFRKLNDPKEMDDAALVEHEKFAGLFLANPVEPPAGGRDDYVADYKGMIQEVKAQMRRIDEEKARRFAAITSDQEKSAHSEIQTLVKQEQFKAALDKLDEYNGKFEQANFATLRTFVEDSAKQAWESAENYAKSRYMDYQAPGIPKAIGEQALRDAQNRMQQVIDRFGIDEYTSQAKALLSKYTNP